MNQKVIKGVSLFLAVLMVLAFVAGIVAYFL